MAWESQSACLLDVWGCGHQGTRCIFMFVCIVRVRVRMVAIFSCMCLWTLS